MSIDDRRQRERGQRRDAILAAAWEVAKERGFSGFSMERVAAQAEIGRATIYSYFVSLDELVATLGQIALKDLEADIARVESISEALDVPVRLSQRCRARFDLLYPQSRDPRPHMNSPELRAVQDEARELMGRLERVARSQFLVLPQDSKECAAFITGVSMAGAMVPELKASTTLRHRFHDFCLKDAFSTAAKSSPKD